MLESLESMMMRTAADVITPVAVTEKSASPTNDTANHLKAACDSKTELTKLKKEQQQREEKLEQLKQEQKKAKLAEGSFVSRQLNTKGNERKKLDAQIIDLEKKISSGKTSIKEKEKTHKDNVAAALSAVKSEDSLQNTSPISAHQAAYIGDQKLFNKVNETVSLDYKSKGGNTVLHAAVLGGDKSTIEEAIKSNQDLLKTPNELGQTPIHLAAMSSNSHSQSWVEWSKGKDAYREINIIEIIPKMSPALDIPDKQGKTALHYAAERGDLKTVEALIKKGADPNAVDDKGKTPANYIQDLIDRDGKDKNGKEIPGYNKQNLEAAKDSIVAGIQSYADNQFAIADIENETAKRNTAKDTLKAEEDKLPDAQQKVDDAKQAIKDTTTKLEDIKKKIGYQKQITDLGTPTEVDISKKTELENQLKDTEEPNLKNAREEVARRKKEIKDLHKKIEAAQKNIKKKAEYNRQVEELKTQINNAKKHPDLSISPKKRDKAVSDLIAEKDTLIKKRDAIGNPDQAKQILEDQLSTLNNDSDEHKGSLKQAQKEEREAQEAIDLTKAQLVAIEEKKALQTKIARLEAKRDAIKVTGDTGADINLEGEQTRLTEELAKLNGDKETDGSLKQAEKEKKDLDLDIKKQQDALAIQDAKIAKTEKLIKEAGLKQDAARPRALNAAIAAGKSEEVKKLLAPLAELKGPALTEELAKYNVADRAGRTPLSHAMEKGFHAEMSAISAPLEKEYRDAQKTYAIKIKDANETVRAYENGEKEFKKLQKDLTKANAGELPEGYKNKEEIEEKINVFAGLEKSDVDDATKDIEKAEKELVAARDAFNPKDNNGKTPLDYAIKADNAQGAALFGHTELHMKAGKSKGFEDKEVAVTDANKDSQNINGETPLHIAAKSGNTEMATALVEAEANLSLRDREGNTPLHVAVQNGNTEITKALVKKDPELLKTAGKDGLNPLEMAAMDKDNGGKLLESLLKEVSDDKATLLTAQYKDGKTLAELSIEQGNIQVLESIKTVNGTGITDEQLDEAKKKRKELDKKALEEEEQQRKAEAAKDNPDLTPEQRAAMAGSAPSVDGQQQQTNSTGQNSKDPVGKVWKEDMQPDGSAIIGDPSGSHFKQTSKDGKFDYKMEAKPGDDKTYTLKIPSANKQPPNDIIKYKNGVIIYAELNANPSQLSDDMKKQVAEFKAKQSGISLEVDDKTPPQQKGPSLEPTTPSPPPKAPEVNTPTPPAASKKKNDPVEIPKFDPTKMKEKHSGDATIVGGTVAASSTPMGKAVKTRTGSMEI